MSKPRRTCQQAGDTLAKMFVATFNGLSGEMDDIPDDYDRSTVLMELTVLGYVGCRLAIQRTGLSHEQMVQISRLLDRCFIETTDMGDCKGFLDHRGEQYHSLLNQHADRIQNGDVGQFNQDLVMKLDQFCRDGGEDDAPLVIGDFFSMASLGSLVSRTWDECFWGSYKHLTEVELGSS